jgi:fructokinase
MASKIVGLGELLWDMLPAGKQLGGAPANFAYISTLLGNDGIVASRIGADLLGDEALRRLEALHVNTSFIEKDSTHPTGTVQVTVDHAGQPKFGIAEGVAWDFLEWSSAWQELARQANAVCFGSLAQRNAATRATIRQFLKTVPVGVVIVFDVNLRQNFFSREILEDSMQLADVVKLNHEELPRIAQLFGIHHRDEIGSADTLMERHDLKLICITRGCNGSLLITPQGLNEHKGYRIQVADTVGAGDAFTAGLVTEFMRGSSIKEMNETANRVGAWVASQVGAMPSPGEGGIRAEMARIS